MARILIIDDDDNIIRLLNRILKNAGYDVIEAVNGREGLKVFKKDQIDLVITDIFMPEKEGMETVVELQMINPEIKIIAISGGGTDCRCARGTPLQPASQGGTPRKAR